MSFTPQIPAILSNQLCVASLWHFSIVKVGPLPSNPIAVCPVLGTSELIGEI